MRGPLARLLEAQHARIQAMLDYLQKVPADGVQGAVDRLHQFVQVLFIVEDAVLRPEHAARVEEPARFMDEAEMRHGHDLVDRAFAGLYLVEPGSTHHAFKQELLREAVTRHLRAQREGFLPGLLHGMSASDEAAIAGVLKGRLEALDAMVAPHARA